MDYGSINAKVKCLKGNLYTYEDYLNLAAIKTVQDFGEKIKEYPSYAGVIDSIDHHCDFRRSVIERKLALSLAEEFKRISSFMADSNIRRYLEGYALREEVDIIKMMLCAVMDHRDLPYSVGDLHLLVKTIHHLDVEKLAGSKDINEFIYNLYPSRYYESLKQVHLPNPTLFDYSLSLDLFYYMHLWKLNKIYLSGKNKKVMDKITGTEIDLQNILWLYRLKKHYQMESENIFGYMIPIKYRLSSEQIIKMVEARDLPQFMEVLEHTFYKNVFRDGPSPEADYYLQMSAVCRKAETMEPNSIGTVISYLTHKKLEIKNIVSILEGIRYNLSPEEIMAYVMI